MYRKHYGLFIAAGFLAGCVNALMGAGGGLILIPLLSLSHIPDEQELFPFSVGIMGSVCALTLLLYSLHHPLPWKEALPYLIGSSIGGICSGIWRDRIPVKWLHRGLGLLIIWGGIRYLC